MELKQSRNDSIRKEMAEDKELFIITDLIFHFHYQFLQPKDLLISEAFLLELSCVLHVNSD